MDQKLVETRELLDEVSPSFCLAKWAQVTLHLQTGHNHSCHHPPTHKIDAKAIKENPAALHNTEHKKARRQQMLDGEKPVECDFCWAVERNGTDQVSDRILKSASEWARPRYADVLKAGAKQDIVPSYMEVSFSNVCNFKCSYCSPPISSKWMEEVQQHGGYPTSGKFNDLKFFEENGQMPIPNREPNPYVDAFWEWWPKLYSELTDFRITGGEPLLARDTFRVLEYVIAHPNPNLRLSVNTNLCVPPAVTKKFFKLIEQIVVSRACAGFILYTSADTHGDQADYIRNGMNYSIWRKNLSDYLTWAKTQPPEYGKVVVMCAFNALSVPRFWLFYSDMMELRVESNRRIIVDMPHLTYPRHQSMWVLPDRFGESLEQTRDMICANPNALEIERIKIRRIVDIFQKREWTDQELIRYQKDFGLFFQEHDRRRGTNFSQTFPELSDFYQECLAL